MAMSSGAAGVNAKTLIDQGRIQAAYDLLLSMQQLSPRDAYYLAYCFMKLNPGKLRESIECFDTAEAMGCVDYWLYYHRSRLHASLGNNGRALGDALQVLAKDPLPETIDLALRSLAVIAKADSMVPIANSQAIMSTLLPAIWRQIRQLRSRLDAANRKIILVDKGDFEAFVYQGDVSASPSPGRKTLPASPLTPQQFIDQWDKAGDILSMLIAWYLNEQIGTAFFDIGSNIGGDAIRIARLSRLIKQEFPITAFEPGLMGALLPHNLQLNGVVDLVRFEEKCVSNDSKPQILFGEAGATTNNRIVNRNITTESFSKIVNSITISEYMAEARFYRRHPVMKIDTQGAEWFIWNGLKEELPRRSISMVMELTPWALDVVVSTRRFLEEILESFYVIDLGYDRETFCPITADTLDERLRYVQQNAPYWTDLLCISRSLPSGQRLADRISIAYGASTTKMP